MKVLKTIIGIVLIVAAVFAIYYWNIQGKEKLAKLETEKVEILPIESEDPNQRVYDMGFSFFSIPEETIYEKSSLLKAGDFVSLYTADTKENLGKFEVALVPEEGIEIICSVDDYFRIDSFRNSKFVIVMEESNG